jgi:methionyl-tRNA formyltransferase
VNAHYALLPAYAGLSPYFWYLHQRERHCGVTFHQIISKLDAGPIIEQSEFSIEHMRTVMAVLLEQTAQVLPGSIASLMEKPRSRAQRPKISQGAAIIDTQREIRYANFTMPVIASTIRRISLRSSSGFASCMHECPNQADPIGYFHWLAHGVSRS